MSGSALQQGSAWVTSSYGCGADTSPMQLSALGEHLSHCSRPASSIEVLVEGAEALRGFVLGRLVTTVTAVSAVVGGSWLIWF